MPLAIAGILSAFGLSGAAGLNAYVPLLLVSVLGRLDVLHLSGPFAIMTNGWIIALLVVLLIVELVVDKIPGADHINDIIQTFIRPSAGAILFGASSGALGEVHPAIPLACGLIVALSVHATKSVARPVINAGTLGLGAPVISAVEDVASVGTSLVAVFAPIIVLVFAVVFAFVVYKVWSSRRARAKRKDEGEGAPVERVASQK